MARFISQALSRDGHLGQTLAAAREARHLSLRQMAVRLGVAERYLVAIEAGDFDAMPQGGYGKYFVRHYAMWLGLDPTPLLAGYPEDILPTSGALAQVQRSELTPVHPLRRLLFVFGIVVVVGYLAVGAWYTLLPPKLELVSPAADGTTTAATAVVAGSTSVGAEVTINGTSAEVSEVGRFVVTVPLQPGINAISVVAHTAYSRKVGVQRRLYYTPVPAEPSAMP